MVGKEGSLLIRITLGRGRKEGAVIGMKSLRTLLCEGLMKAKFGPTAVLLGILGTNRGRFGIFHSWVLGEIPWDLSPDQKPLQQEGAVLTKMIVLKRCLYHTVQQGLWLLGKETQSSAACSLLSRYSGIFAPCLRKADSSANILVCHRGQSAQG